jgi:hypothetical protein
MGIGCSWGWVFYAAFLDGCALVLIEKGMRLESCIFIGFVFTTVFFLSVAGELWFKQKKKGKGLSGSGILDYKVRKCIIMHAPFSFLSVNCNYPRFT